MVLAVVETHPIQYHAPVYRTLQSRFGIPVVAIYGSDFSVAGGVDREFGESFAWDTDLLTGYGSIFLPNVSPGSATSVRRASWRNLGGAIRSIAPRAILLVGYSPRFHQVAFWNAWKQRLPIILRAETTDHAKGRSLAKTMLRDCALRFLYSRCARLMFVGQHSLQHYRRLGCPSDKLISSPYCVDTAPFEVDEMARARLRPSMRRELMIDDDQLAIIFSGKLSERKGPDLLVEAVRELPPAVRKRIVVLFLGSGDMWHRLEALARKDPMVATRFVGFQNQTKLSPYYHAADLLVLPSRNLETWGLVVNEALHHGVPCVVTDAVGCAPDLIHPGVTGEVCSAESASSLAASIDRALVLTGRVEIRERCRQVVGSYSVERAATGIARAYDEVVGASSGRHTR